MGLIGKLLGKKDGPKAGGKQWMHTNAPAHWPRMEHTHINDQNVELAVTINTISIGADLKRKGLDLVYIGKSRLFAEGIMHVDIQLKENGKLYNIFIYPDIYEDAASHFNLCKRMLSTLGEIAVYYSFAPMDPNAPASKKLDRWRVEMFNNVGKREAPEKFCLWWSTPEDPVFSKSPVCEHLQVAFENIQGYEHIMLTMLGRTAEIFKDKDGGFGRLPDKVVIFPVIGPDLVPVCISASAKTGLQFHFERSTSTLYRNNFWKLYREYAQWIRPILDSEPGMRREYMDPTPLTWFNAFRGVHMRKEMDDEAPDEIGVIIDKEEGRK